MTDERGGRYFREARFFLAGDKVAAQSHILEARSLMGYMRDQHALGGPPIQTKYATLQDGTTIKATMMNGQYQANIYSPIPEEDKQEDECMAFYSGLLIPKQEADHLRIVGDVTETYRGMEWMQPSAYQMSVSPGLMGAYPEYPDKFAVESFAKIEPKAPYLDGPALMFMSVHPSSYSGEMRKVVQLLLGAGDTLLNGLGEPVLQFGFSGTIGLVTALDSEVGTPFFWMVRMPSGGRGMLAMKYPVCYNITKAQLDVGVEYIPESGVRFPDDIDAAIADGTVLEVMAKADFDTILAGGLPTYNECGWAFSSSGHECQNVVYNTYGGVTTMRRIKFEFVATIDAIAVTGEQVESAPIKCDAYSAPRFPDMGLFSVMPFFPAIESTHVGNCSAPIHVFYVGDAEQVCRFSFSDIGGTVDDNLPTTGVGAARCPGIFQRVEYSDGASRGTYTRNGAALNTQSVTGQTVTTTQRYYMDGELPGQPEYLLVSSGGVAGSARAVRLGEVSWQEISYSATAFVVCYSAFTVPLFQREGVFVLDASMSDSGAYTRQTTYTGVAWEYAEDLRVREIAGVIWYIQDTPPNVLDPVANNLFTACPNTVSGGLATTFSGGIGLTGIPGTATSQSVAGSANPPTENVPAAQIWQGSTKFFGTADVTLTSLSELQIMQCYQPPTAITGQLVFAYTDAFDPSSHIISPTVSAGTGPSFINSTQYDLSDGTVFYNFIGIATP